LSKSIKAVIAIIVIAVIIGFPVITTYNKLVSLDQKVKSAQSNIETLLERRSALIPNLVETVRGYAAQEKDILTELANARTKLAGSVTLTDKANADSQLSSALSRLLVVVEKYPDLKSSQSFRDLTVSLEGTENRIAIARQDYNKTVDNYNTAIKRFPSSVVASLFRFDEKTYFRASVISKEVPKVEFKKE